MSLRGTAPERLDCEPLWRRPRRTLIEKRPEGAFFYLPRRSRALKTIYIILYFVSIEKGYFQNNFAIKKESPAIAFRNKRIETLLTQGRCPPDRFVLPASCRCGCAECASGQRREVCIPLGRSPGSFLLFVGFYAHCYLAYSRRQMLCNALTQSTSS
jgi:hypothetical protein